MLRVCKALLSCTGLSGVVVKKALQPALKTESFPETLRPKESRQVTVWIGDSVAVKGRERVPATRLPAACLISLPLKLTAALHRP